MFVSDIESAREMSIQLYQTHSPDGYGMMEHKES